MRKILITIACVYLAALSFGQSIRDYEILIKKADSLYKIKSYKDAAHTYSDAFKTLGWKAYSNDRYKAICAWSMANLPDSAFFHLNLLFTKNHFSDYDLIKADPDLSQLHFHPQWQVILAMIDKAEAKYNKPLKKLLDSVYVEDQKYRKMSDSIAKAFGTNSDEFQNLWSTIRVNDALNLITVTNILDKYGWLGAEEIGEQANTTLFLVIQHADLKTQEKYASMMREAVKSGKAKGSQLPLLIDRIEMRNGRKQIYGSQLQGTAEGGYKIYPIEDEKNVNKRRVELGLEKLEDYAKRWGIIYKPLTD